MQTILGAGGAIGKHLARELTNYTNRIRLVSRNPQKVNPSDELFIADLSIPNEIEHAVEGSDVVYLTIGFKYSARVWKENWPVLMRNVIAACKMHQCKLVFFDNVYMYDRYHMDHMTEETPVRPTSKKGQVRADIAKILWDEMVEGDFDALIARSADFIGPTNSIPVELIYRNLAKGKKAAWMADAQKIHNCTNTLDAARGTAILGNTKEAFNQIWHLPTDQSQVTGKQWVELFADKMGKKPDYKEIPLWTMALGGLFVPMLRELKEMGYQYNRDYFFDSSKFTRKFSYKPYTPEESVQFVLDELR